MIGAFLQVDNDNILIYRIPSWCLDVMSIIREPQLGMSYMILFVWNRYQDKNVIGMIELLTVLYGLWGSAWAAASTKRRGAVVMQDISSKLKSIWNIVKYRLSWGYISMVKSVCKFYSERGNDTDTLCSKR